MEANNPSSRSPLTRERILQAAVGLADQKGLDALTMRRLGTELGVEAMSLYKHIANKDEILDGMSDLVVGEIEVPRPGSEWRQAMRERAVSAREVLSRHSWAIGLFESRGARGPAILRYVNAILGNLRSAGFSVDAAVHAFWLLDSYVYGHVVQETATATGTREDVADSAGSAFGEITIDEFPHLVEMEQHALTSEYSFDAEFAFGLDLILDGLEGLRESPPRGEV